MNHVPEVRAGDEVVYEGERYTVEKVTPGSHATMVRAESDAGTAVFEMADAAPDGPVTLIPSEVLEMGEDAVQDYLDSI